MDSGRAYVGYATGLNHKEIIENITKVKFLSIQGDHELCLNTSKIECVSFVDYHKHMTNEIAGNVIQHLSNKED